MSEQLALNIIAAGVGFIAGIFFCIGNVLNTSDAIAAQVTLRRTGYIEPLAHSLAAQRAQYVFGAVFLVVAFVFQLAAALASSTAPAPLPLALQSWPCLLAAVIIPTGLAGSGGALLLRNYTIRKVQSHVQSSIGQASG